MRSECASQSETAPILICILEEAKGVWLGLNALSFAIVKFPLVRLYALVPLLIIEFVDRGTIVDER